MSRNVRSAVDTHGRLPGEARPKTVVRSVRASAADWQRWLQAASQAGLTPNKWARRALNRQADLEAALAREDER